MSPHGAHPGGTDILPARGSSLSCNPLQLSDCSHLAAILSTLPRKLSWSKEARHLRPSQSPPPEIPQAACHGWDRTDMYAI